MHSGGGPALQAFCGQIGRPATLLYTKPAQVHAERAWHSDRRS
jgi:hypothetical protein